MIPPAEHVHWLFATGFLILGLCLLAETIVGPEVWRRRKWRVYLWPSIAFGLGILMWPVMVFFTSSTIHMLAHGVWAQTMMAAGAAELGLAHGKLRNPLWRIAVPVALVTSGVAFLVHEQNGWYFQRSSFLHHVMGWTAVGAGLVLAMRVPRPRSAAVGSAFALTFVLFAVLLYCDRDIAPIFGHLSSIAGTPHR